MADATVQTAYNRDKLVPSGYVAVDNIASDKRQEPARIPALER